MLHLNSRPVSLVKQEIVNLMIKASAFFNFFFDTALIRFDHFDDVELIAQIAIELNC